MKTAHAVKLATTRSNIRVVTSLQYTCAGKHTGRSWLSLRSTSIPAGVLLRLVCRELGRIRHSTMHSANATMPRRKHTSYTCALFVTVNSASFIGYEWKTRFTHYAPATNLQLRSVYRIGSIKLVPARIFNNRAKGDLLIASEFLL